MLKIATSFICISFIVFVTYLIVIFIYGFFTFGQLDRGSENQVYCNFLKQNLSNPETKDYILNWAKQHVFDKEIKEGDLIFENRIQPGRFKINSESIKWEVLGYSNILSQINVINYKSFNNEGENKIIINSLFFSERSGYGYLVKNPKEDNFDINISSNEVEIITKELAILCLSRY